MNISNNIASIQAHQNMMNTSANNTANVNTDKFIPSDTKIHSKMDSVSSYTRKAEDNGSLRSQTNLSREIPNQMLAQNAIELNTTSIKTQDEILGTLLDIKA